MVKPLGTTYRVSWIHRLVQGSDVPRRVHSWIHCLVQGSDIPGRVHSWVHRLVQGSDIPGRVHSWIHHLVQGGDVPGRVRLPHTGPVTGPPSEVCTPGCRAQGVRIPHPGARTRADFVPPCECAWREQGVRPGWGPGPSVLWTLNVSVGR